MNLQNRSAQRRPANNVSNPKEEVQDGGNQRRAASGLNDVQESRMKVEPSLQNTMELLDRYSQLLDELNIEHADTTQVYTALESDIMAREITCGRLMRQHLELGEQIRSQKESILAKKDELKKISGTLPERGARKVEDQVLDVLVERLHQAAKRDDRSLPVRSWRLKFKAERKRIKNTCLAARIWSTLVEEFGKGILILVPWSGRNGSLNHR